MSSPEQLPPRPPSEEDDEPSRGPSLVLLYSLLALAFVAAIIVSLFIVLPFYHRR